MEFLKEYQVAEHKDGLWSVVKVGNQMIMGAALRAHITISSHGYHTAAEAQEMADELNKDSDNV